MLKEIKYKGIQSHLRPFMKYSFHLIKGIFTKGKTRQWREANFDFIREKEPKTIPLKGIFRFKKEDYSKVNSLPQMKGKEKKVIIHTGSGWVIKLLENDKWVKALEEINKLDKFKFIFVGNSQKEKEDFEYIQKRLSFKVYSLISQVDLKELTLIMTLSDYFIGVDSGPRNIAHIVDLPSVSLLGPGPQIFMPIKKRDVVINKSNCRCTNLFCYKRKTCMERIEIQEIVEGFKKILK